jgi:dihydrofolate reductase
MSIISLIAAIDEEWGLGIENKLLCHLPADLLHFKTVTMNKPVIMGRKTHESIGKILPGRLNIILSGKISSISDAVVVQSIPEALKITAKVPEVMIIGGATVFEETLPLADRLYLTQIHARFEADVYFPKINLDQWRCIEAIERQQDVANRYGMTFYQYVRRTDK